MPIYCVIQRDAENRQLRMEVVDEANLFQSDYGLINLAIGKADEEGTNRGEGIIFREVRGVNDQGQTAYVLVPRSASYTTRKGDAEPDFFAGGGDVGYQGTWQPIAYSRGAIVRKRSGTMQGVYIARTDATAADEPTYPESGPWDLICFGPIEYLETADDVSGQLRSIYVNGSDRL